MQLKIRKACVNRVINENVLTPYITQVSIGWERPVSFKLLCKRVFIDFVREKLLSTEAISTAMDKLIETIVCKFGNVR